MVAVASERLTALKFSLWFPTTAQNISTASVSMVASGINLSLILIVGNTSLTPYQSFQCKCLMRSLWPSAISWMGAEPIEGLYSKRRRRGTETPRRSSKMVMLMLMWLENGVYEMSTALKPSLWELDDRAARWMMTDVDETQWLSDRDVERGDLGWGYQCRTWTIVTEVKSAPQPTQIGPGKCLQPRRGLGKASAKHIGYYVYLGFDILSITTMCLPPGKLLEAFQWRSEATGSTERVYVLRVVTYELDANLLVVGRLVSEE